jgi:hypothetical protein
LRALPDGRGSDWGFPLVHFYVSHPSTILCRGAVHRLAENGDAEQSVTLESEDVALVALVWYVTPWTW